MDEVVVGGKNAVAPVFRHEFGGDGVEVGLERRRRDHVPLLPEVRHVLAPVDRRVEDRVRVIRELIRLHLIMGQN